MRRLYVFLLLASSLGQPPATVLANPILHGQDAAQIPLSPAAKSKFSTEDSDDHKKQPHKHISPSLFNDFEELSRIVDITYCIGTPSPGIQPPFICPSHCSQFPSFQLVQSWNTGPLMSDSCGYIALSHPPARKRVVVAFRGTYSVANALVDLSTGRQEYVPYPPSGNKTGMKDKIEGDGDDGDDGKVRCEGCWAHAGFLESWRVASEIVVPAVDGLLKQWGPHGYDLELVGHSLGGAVAGLAALEFRERGWRGRVTTFGEPRIGNANLSQYINHLLPYPTYRRITHKSDPVPLLPFSKWGFVHHATEYFIEKEDLPPTSEDVMICEGDEDERCAASGSVNMLQLLWSHRDYFNRLGLCVPDGWRRVLDGVWGPWWPRRSHVH